MEDGERASTTLWKGLRRGFANTQKGHPYGIQRGLAAGFKLRRDSVKIRFD